MMYCTPKTFPAVVLGVVMLSGCGSSRVGDRLGQMGEVARRVSGGSYTDRWAREYVLEERVKRAAISNGVQFITSRTQYYAGLQKAFELPVLLGVYDLSACSVAAIDGFCEYRAPVPVVKGVIAHDLLRSFAGSVLQDEQGILILSKGHVYGCALEALSEWIAKYQCGELKR